jgi:L-rhamnose mutarotase
MYQSNIRNFTIYYHKETSTLFQHFEWIGHLEHPEQDEKAVFQNDMDAIAADPVTREWWRECEPCQEPFSQWKAWSKRNPPSEGGAGEWWAPLECVTHCGHWPLAYSSQRRDPDFVPLSNEDGPTST